MTKTLYTASVYLLIAGITSLLFGIIVLVFPGISLWWLVRLFAAYMVIKGCSLGAGGWRTQSEENHWTFLLWYGIMNIITGIVAFIYPEATMLILGFIASINLLLGGILQIIMAIQLHREIEEGLWLVLSGIITLVAGLYIYLISRIGPVTILYLIAVAALIVAVFLILLSLKARTWHRHIDNQTLQAR